MQGDGDRKDTAIPPLMATEASPDNGWEVARLHCDETSGESTKAAKQQKRAAMLAFTFSV
jgi:hypothetical protein